MHFRVVSSFELQIPVGKKLQRSLHNCKTRVLDLQVPTEYDITWIREIGHWEYILP